MEGGIKPNVKAQTPAAAASVSHKPLAWMAVFKEGPEKGCYGLAGLELEEPRELECKGLEGLSGKE